VFVSNRDVNRVNCPVPVDDVVWSAEKPVKVSHSGTNVFVKFLVQKQGDLERYVSSPLDVHVVCGGEVYTLILHPRDQDSVTVRLGSPERKALKVVAAEWGSLPTEERVKRLTLAVYRQQLPDAFARRRIEPADPRRNVPLFENAQVIGQYEVNATGTGLRAVEYVVYSKEGLRLAESDFLSPLLGDIVGVTVEPLNVEPDSFARLIVVERVKGSADE
jgi:conjugal transfer pilus assembly protein TraK